MQQGTKAESLSAIVGYVSSVIRSLHDFGKGMLQTKSASDIK